MKAVVIGAGVMGPGIAQTFLMGGHDAVLVDVSEEALQKGIDEVQKCLTLMEDMEIIEGADEMFAHLSSASSVVGVVEDADLVVEVVPERPDIKKAVYDQLDSLCKEDALIVSNTSSFPVSEMFPDFRPGNFFVCHFYNPSAINPLVEIVHNDAANLDKVQWLRDILVACDKKPIVINKYIPGFLVNRLQTATTREALYLLDQGIVSEEDLNTATKIGIGYKTAWQGIFDTMDYVGLDTVAFVQTNLVPQLYTGNEIPKVITDKVEQGKLGLKTGEGFYKYGSEAEAIQEKRYMQLVDQLKLYKKYGI